MLNLTPHLLIPRRRARGSVLVIVVAVLMMIALIGTAYIATARLDRYAAWDHTTLVSTEAVRQARLDYIQELVKRAIADDLDSDIIPFHTSYRTQSWLASRLPHRQNIGGSNWTPAWRYISGDIHTSINPLADVYIPPLLNGNSVAGCDGLIKRLEHHPNNSNFGHIIPNTDQFAAVPTSITITYPPDYPVEKYRGKVRTFPAFKFWNTTSNRWFGNPDVFLAADADGDGIADSVLLQITPGPVNGVTYYAAVRIIDNNSAINANTAWSRDLAYDTNGNPSNAAIRTFFPTNIGLRELMANCTNLKLDPDVHMWAINRQRFGYNPARPEGSFENASNASTRVRAATAAYDDLHPAAARSDFAFANQNEGAALQLARRPQNPGRNFDARLGNPKVFKYRGFPETDAAALAYRFCMVRYEPQIGSANLQPVLGTLERTLYNTLANPAFSSLSDDPFDVLVTGAPNFAMNPDFRFNAYPAYETLAWFQWLDYDQNPSSLEFTEGGTNALHVRPLRPLLTAYNATSTQARKRTTVFNWGNAVPVIGFERVTPIVKDYSRLLYPGMLSGTAFDDYPKPNATTGSGNYGFGQFALFNNIAHVFVPSKNALPPASQGSNDNWYDPARWEYQPYVSGRNKASINTAGFPELWRAFYQVMAERRNLAGVPDSDASASPVDHFGLQIGSMPIKDIYYGMELSGTVNQNNYAMFRSPIRDWRKSDSTTAFQRLLPQQVMTLRSALAAVNSMALLDDKKPAASNNPYPLLIPRRQFTLYNVNNPQSPVPQYEVSVFGYKPQPFITEIYADNDTTNYAPYRNVNGYVAIKLYNPYGVSGSATDPGISLRNWIFIALDRYDSDGSRRATLLKAFPNNATAPTVPPNGYLLIESYLPGGTEYRPESTDLNKITGTLNIPGLKAVSVKELVSQDGGIWNKELVLLRPIDPNLSAPANTAALDLRKYAPVDQFDFTGLQLDGSKKTWSYRRKSGGNDRFDCVYPGRYNAYAPTGSPRHQGVRVDTNHDWNWPVTHAQHNLQLPPGNGQPAADPVTLKNTATTDSSYKTNTFNIQLYAKGMPGPFGSDTSMPRYYPYGGFARNGDILQVPYIGAYVIHVGKTIVEVNSITIDSAFAEDGRTSNNADEQLGRFCPISHIKTDINYTTYDWAKDLFDYLDVCVPAEQFMPNAHAKLYPGTIRPYPVPSAEGASVLDAAQGANDRVPVHGLINVNTAPPVVLQMVPWAANPDGSIKADSCANIANAIVSHRESTGTNLGPFASLFDLNMVNDPTNNSNHIFVSGDKTLDSAATPAQDNGVWPSGNLPDDFKKQFLSLNRVSNLLTTRSDTFTCYILVQGWREDRTNLHPPSLDWEQRKAFIIDRSAGKHNLKIIPVPTD